LIIVDVTKTALQSLSPVGFLSCQNALEEEFSKQIEMLTHDVQETKKL